MFQLIFEIVRFLFVSLLLLFEMEKKKKVFSSHDLKGMEIELYGSE